ncbi:MAG: TonB-dependent receptor, partial [Pseudomonadota bacterium]
MVSRTFARLRSTAFASAASAISILAAAPAAVGQTPAPSIQMLNIPAGPLGDSLLAINQAFGVSVLALEEAVAGKTAPQVSGAMTAEDALRRVLAGSGLTARTASDGSFVISEIKSPSVSAMPGADAVDAEMIIVTGTKANFGLQDTVESVAVITPDDIREQALNTITDILLRTANVSANGLGLGDLSIRGVALGGVGGTGQGSTSQIYVDGAPTTLDSSIGAFNLWDLGQVEILRGPQSTTQGRNALSGALIIRSADPDYDFGANARVLYGNENQLQTSAAITGPLIDEQIAFRLSADYRELDFEVINQDTGNNTRFSEALMLRGKVLFELAEIPRLRAMFTANYMSNNFGESGAVSAPDMADPAFADFDPFGNETFGFGTRFEDTEIQRYIAEVSYDVSETWNLFALATFEDSTRQTDFGPGSENNADTQTYTAELRANFEYDRFSGWFGGYYFNSERTSSIVFSDS